MHVYYTRGSTSQLARVECEENDEMVTLIVFHLREFKKIKKKRQLQTFLSVGAFRGSVAFFWQHNSIALTNATFFSAVMQILNFVKLLDDEDKPTLNKFIDNIVKDRSSKNIMLVDTRTLIILKNENKRLSRANFEGVLIECRKSKVRRIYWNESADKNVDVVMFQFSAFKSNVKRQRLLIYLSAMKVFNDAVAYDWQKNRLILTDFYYMKMVLTLLRSLHLLSREVNNDLLEIVGLESTVNIELEYLNLSAIYEMSKVLLKNYIESIFNQVELAEGMAVVKLGMLLVMQSTSDFAAGLYDQGLSFLWKEKYFDALTGINSILNGYMSQPLSANKGCRRAVKDELRRYALDCILESMHKKFKTEKISDLFFAMRELVIAMNKFIKTSAVYNTSSPSIRVRSGFFAQPNSVRPVGAALTLDYNDVGKILYALKLIDDDGRSNMQKIRHLQQLARCADIDHYIQIIEYNARQNAADSGKLSKAVSSCKKSRSQ